MHIYHLFWNMNINALISHHIRYSLGIDLKKWKWHRIFALLGKHSEKKWKKIDYQSWNKELRIKTPLENYDSLRQKFFHRFNKRRLCSE